MTAEAPRTPEDFAYEVFPSEREQKYVTRVATAIRAALAARDAEMLPLLREAREICDLLHGFEYGTDRGVATVKIEEAYNVALAASLADKLRGGIDALLSEEGK